VSSLHAVEPPKIGFLAFFLLWAQRMRWTVPPLHVRVCVWLEDAWLNGWPILLLMLPRGHAKSTILGVFNAWVYYCWPRTRILHQSESNPTAYKTSRDTQNVLQHHPLTRGMIPDGQGTVESWWVRGAMEADARNPSMYARGILSNVTSARADFVQNDDVEVPANIQTAEAREKMRYRLGEQTHIAVPGAPTLYVGTPHTHDSLYEDVKRKGAHALVIRMFEQECRIEKAIESRYPVPFDPEFVFAGIGEHARLLLRGADYTWADGELRLASPGGELLDCYADAAWPERFDAAELLLRRRKTNTINEWDSQYQLHAKPVTQVRLDPSRLTAFGVLPRLHRANGGASLWLGKVQIVGATAHWDPSSGKLNADRSAVAVCYQDDGGRRYVPFVGGVTGDIAEFASDGKTITGGQVWDICNIVERHHLRRITVETNGIGTFAPTVLRAALKQRHLNCGVVELQSSEIKNRRILGTLEPLLTTRQMLWVHADLLRTPEGKPSELWTQMRDWNPMVKDQPDDLLDALQRAVSDTPERIAVHGNGGIARSDPANDWRPTSGSFEVEFGR